MAPYIATVGHLSSLFNTLDRMHPGLATVSFQVRSQSESPDFVQEIQCEMIISSVE